MIHDLIHIHANDESYHHEKVVVAHKAHSWGMVVAYYAQDLSAVCRHLVYCVHAVLVVWHHLAFTIGV